MNEVLLTINAFGLTIVLTGWTLLGYLGLSLFGGRWLVQVIYSARKGQSHVPALFWYMSLFGSSCLLAYFLFGKSDSVGILSNLFPSAVAAYNLFLLHSNKKKQPIAQP